MTDEPVRPSAPPMAAATPIAPPEELPPPPGPVNLIAEILTGTATPLTGRAPEPVPEAERWRTLPIAARAKRNEQPGIVVGANARMTPPVVEWIAKCANSDELRFDYMEFTDDHSVWIRVHPRGNLAVNAATGYTPKAGMVGAFGEDPAGLYEVHLPATGDTMVHGDDGIGYARVTFLRKFAFVKRHGKKVSK